MAACEGLCVQDSHQLAEEPWQPLKAGGHVHTDVSGSLFECVWVNPNRGYPIQDKIRPARPYIADRAGVAKKSPECKPTVEAKGREESKKDRHWNGHQT